MENAGCVSLFRVLCAKEKVLKVEGGRRKCCRKLIECVEELNGEPLL